MEHLPLTRPAPFEAIPAGMETLWPELPPAGARPVRVTVTLPDGEMRHCRMDIVAAEDSVLQMVAVALEACRGVAGFELVVKPFAG